MGKVNQNWARWASVQAVDQQVTGEQYLKLLERCSVMRMWADPIGGPCQDLAVKCCCNKEMLQRHLALHKSKGLRWNWATPESPGERSRQGQVYTRQHTHACTHLQLAATYSDCRSSELAQSSLREIVSNQSQCWTSNWNSKSFFKKKKLRRGVSRYTQFNKWR